jgi:hypothetical protein
MRYSFFERLLKSRTHVDLTLNGTSAHIDTQRIYVEPLKDGTYRLAYSTGGAQSNAVAATIYSENARPDAVKWSQKPLDCRGITVSGPGKIDIQESEIPIPTGPIDIREFTVRKP